MPLRRLLPLFALLLAALPRPAAAQDGLSFSGFEPGAHLRDVAARLAELGSGPLRCERSRADRRVLECRAGVTSAELGGPAELWLSAVDSVAGVITLSAAVESERLATWRERLEDDFGPVGARVQGTQWMMQWVRRGRMVRLTWRVEGNRKAASVSLVDGHVLDDWGRSRPRSRAGR